MASELYCYNFAPTVILEDIEALLVMAIVSAESLHGETQVRLDAAHFFDQDRRACVIDAGTAVGRDLNRLFAGFVTREFGADAFGVERVTQPTHQHPQEVQTCC